MVPSQKLKFYPCVTLSWSLVSLDVATHDATSHGPLVPGALAAPLALVKIEIPVFAHAAKISVQLGKIMLSPTLSEELFHGCCQDR